MATGLEAADRIASEAGTSRAVAVGTAMPLEGEREDTADRQRAAAAIAAPPVLDPEEEEDSVAVVAAAVVADGASRWASSVTGNRSAAWHREV